MKLSDLLSHPMSHEPFINVGIDDHHDQPEIIEAVNTSLSVSPLPGGPGVWDIPVPLNAQVVAFSFKAAKATGPGGNGNAGVAGVATRSSIEASALSFADWSQHPIWQLPAFYSKPAASLNLSHKVFTASGEFISLTDIYLTLTGPSTRVLRTEWTNYGFAYYTLNAWGEIAVIG